MFYLIISGLSQFMAKLSFRSHKMTTVISAFIYVVVFMSTVTSPVFSSPASLVKDINVESKIVSSNPSDFVGIGNTTYFVANNRLWKTDGTTNGTIPVGGPEIEVEKNTLININDTLYFSASDRAFGQELWKSDGTATGTAIVKNINIDSHSSSPSNLTEVNGIIYFSADDGIHGRELWKSNGTAAGTKLVKDIEVGPRASNPSNLTNVNGILYFVAGDDTALDSMIYGYAYEILGRELWRSDGTTVGTKLVKDIWQDSDCIAYDQLGFDCIIERPNSSSPKNLVSLNGILYFSASNYYGRKLWQSDGTSAGTVIVKNISISDGNIYHPSPFTIVNDILYFAASDDVGGTELWRSDGTSAGTVIVKDISESGSSFPKFLTNVNGVLYFVASDGVSGKEIWQSDGTAVGTKMVKDISEGVESSDPRSLTRVNNILYFSVIDGDVRKLWQSDGTATGTVLVKNISLSRKRHELEESLANVNGVLYFSADDGVNGMELWQSDGTEMGTILLKNIALDVASSTPGDFASLSGKLYFSAYNNTHGRQLWLSDGSAFGTKIVKEDVEYNGEFYPSSPRDLINIDNTLYFSATNSGYGYGYGRGFGRELWQSDGSGTGTTLLKDVLPYSGGDPFPRPLSSSPQSLANINGTLYFTAADFEVIDEFDYGLSKTGRELWVSDGTTDGTRLVKDIWSGKGCIEYHNIYLDSCAFYVPYSSSPKHLVNLNGALYFSADDGENGRELWKSDGTADGTVLVKDINLGTYCSVYAPQYKYGCEITSPLSSSPSELVVINGVLYFSANTSSNGVELWQSDGTADGTRMLLDIVIGNESSEPRDLVNVNGTLYFSAYDNVHGRELWQSDGTVAGTKIVSDIIPGSGSSSPAELANVDGMLYFSAYDEINGREFWQSDGTILGTKLVQDIEAGIDSSDPANFLISGSQLFFTANRRDVGTELWAIRYLTILEGVGNQSVEAGMTLNYTVKASGAEGAIPELSVTGLPAGASFIDNKNGTGTFSWDTTESDVGIHENIIFTATDGVTSDSETIIITVNEAPVIGKLSGTVAVTSGNVDLSSIGSADWVQWGLNSGIDVNRNADVVPQISNLIPVNGTKLNRGKNNLSVYSWSNGSPEVSVTNTNSGIRSYNIDKGFEITVPADTTLKTLKLYVGAKNVSGLLEASLSDGSAPLYTTKIYSYSDTVSRVITLDFHADSADQTLTVRYTLDSKPGTTGWISIEAAALQGEVGNLAPSIISDPIITGLEGAIYNYEVKASDDDVDDTLSFALTAAPIGMSIDSTTGLISWTPTSGQLGNNSVTVSVTDNGSPQLSDSQSFVVNVVEANVAPSIISEPITTAPEAVLYIYDVVAVDANVGDKLGFSLVTAPEEMQIVESSGKIGWLPVSQDIGNHNVTVMVTDNGNPQLSFTQSFVVSVTENHLAPQIISSPVSNAKPGQIYNYETFVIDKNTSDTLNYELIVAPTGMSLQPYYGRYVINWTPTVDQVGDHNVTLRVTDNSTSQLSDSQSFVISVKANGAPIVTSTAITSASESLPYTYDVDVSDSDVDDVLSFSLSVAPIGMSIDSTTGLINWIPSSADVGDHDVTVVVTDNGLPNLSGIQSFKVNVQAAPAVGKLSGQASKSSGNVDLTNEGINDWIHWGLNSGTDVNRKADVDVQISNLIPVNSTGLNRGKNSLSVFSWTDGSPATNVSKTTSGIRAYKEGKGFEITVPADTSMKTLKLYVGAKNVGGLIEASLSDSSALDFSIPIEKFSGTVSQLLSLNFQAMSAGQTLTVRYTLYSKPGTSGWISIEAAALQVAVENLAPIIISTPVITGSVEFLYKYDVDAIVANAEDVLSYSLKTAPDGMTIDATTGAIRWIPTSAQVGDHEVIVIVSEVGMLQNFGTQAYKVRVEHSIVIDPPLNPCFTSGAVGIEMGCRIIPDPNKGEVLSFALTVVPAGMTIDAKTGVISWTPVVEGSYFVTVSISYVGSPYVSESRSFTISVTGNVAPVIISVPVTNGQENVAYRYDVEATDKNSSDVLSFALVSAPAGMTIDAVTGLINWTPDLTQIGDHAIEVNVVDDGGLIGSQIYTLSVIPAGPSDGWLEGQALKSLGNVDLSSEGKVDWIHWGLNSGADVNRKAGVDMQISNLIPVNATGLNRGKNSLSVFSWIDGAPATTVSKTISGIRAYKEGKGFEITVPADTSMKTLKLYVGAKNVGGLIEAILSDSSAPNYSTTIDHFTSITSRVINLDFQAMSAGQTLTVRYTLYSKPGSTGWISVESAALQIP